MMDFKGDLRRRVTGCDISRRGDKSDDEASLWLQGKVCSRWKKRTGAKALKKEPALSCSKNKKVGVARAARTRVVAEVREVQGGHTERAGALRSTERTLFIL